MPNKFWMTGILFPVIFLLFLVTSCNKLETKVKDEKLEATADSIQRTFVNRSCVSCHTEATSKNRYVSLVDINSVIEKPGHSHRNEHVRFLIKPGCPKQSFFLSIIREGKMPPAPAEKVSLEAIQTLEKFIVSLNPNATPQACDDEPPDTEE